MIYNYFTIFWWEFFKSVFIDVVSSDEHGHGGAHHEVGHITLVLLFVSIYQVLEDLAKHITKLRSARWVLTAHPELTCTSRTNVYSHICLESRFTHPSLEIAEIYFIYTYSNLWTLAFPPHPLFTRHNCKSSDIMEFSSGRYLKTN